MAFTLTLYDENDEIINEYTKSRIPWGFMKKALRLCGIDDKNIDEKTLDEISDFVCELFGNRFTRKELEDGATMDEIFALLHSIASTAEGYSTRKNA